MIAIVSAVLTLMASVLASPAADTGSDEVVNVYSSRHYDSDDALYERFTAETGIRVNLIEGNSDQLLARLDREGELSPADVFITVDAARLERALQAGVLASVQSDELERRVPENLRDPEGRWFALTKRVRLIVASKERVPAGAITSYADLADERWRGRVLIRSSSSVYNQSLIASLIERIGAETTTAWCEGVVANFARTPQGGDRDQVRAIAAGEGDVAVVNHYYVAQMLAGDGADRRAAESVRVIFPDQGSSDTPLGGAHVNISGAGVIKTAPNRENAIRFIEFLLRDESQKALVSGTLEYPVAENVEIHEILRGFGAFRPADVPVSAMAERNREAVQTMDRAGWR
ncbi:MAG: Fe(3+) ABC transporter substrate-binding protein [Phycisphaerales bacterium]|nr:Fe(3+) ABC transporter substrate-binding protein [Phycisphaerales bacterium]